MHARAEEKKRSINLKIPKIHLTSFVNFTFNCFQIRVGDNSDKMNWKSKRFSTLNQNLFLTRKRDNRKVS